jgi:Rad3-related DNA helicase
MAFIISKVASMKSHPIQFFEKYQLTARSEQKHVLDKLHEHWNNYTFFIGNLPTGVGKTYIACSIADSNKNAYMLTSTLQLQEQYESSWTDIVNLKGRGNYKCNLNPEFTVDSAPCFAAPELVSECKRNGTCEYYSQKNKALNAKAMITNPVYLLYSKHCGFASDDDDPWVKRELLVIDEAHNLENHLISFAQSKIDPAKLAEEHGAKVGQFKFGTDHRRNYELLLVIQNLLQEKADEYAEKLEKEFPKGGSSDKSWARGLSAKVAERVRKLNAKIYALDKSIQPLSIFFGSHETFEEMETKWLMHYDPQDNTLQLSPIYGNFLFDTYIRPLANKFLFLSATPGSKNEFCKELGIPDEECLYIESDTPFPPEKSPLIILPQLKMGMRDIQTTLTKVPALLEQILDIHKGERGIIHCATYKLQDEIYRRLAPAVRARLVCRDMDVINNAIAGKSGFTKRYTNAELIKIHHDNRQDGSVLLSPSMMEGIDLHDDLASFQIILKMPWPSLGDPRIKRKSEIDPNWYTNKVWVHIMQAAGRSTRHAEDESVTYVLDASFPYFYGKWKNNLPAWFKRRVTD